MAAIGCAAVVRGFAPPGAIQFEEVAQKAGLLFELRNGESGRFHQIELMAGGVAVLDYNNDGCMDMFFTNGAAIPSLKKSGTRVSQPALPQQLQRRFADVTSQAGVAGEGYSMAVAAADFDNDGFTDIFVAGVHRNSLVSQPRERPICRHHTGRRV